MLSDGLASWLAWVSLLMIVLSIIFLVFFDANQDYNSHDYDKGFDTLATFMRFVTLVAFVFALFYSLISLSVNHNNSVSESFTGIVEDKYGLSLSRTDIIDLADGEAVSVDGKLLFGFEYKKDIIVFEYKDGILEELPKLK